MTNRQHDVELALRAFARGEMVVVTDDKGRENEGDLIVAASHCTPEQMAFIVRYSSGIVCTPITQEVARHFNLPPMVADNDSPHSTAFTISVDYRHGTSTGISAHDRTLSVRNLANPLSTAADFVRPGHIFPLVAREGGVLRRSGHTEAAVDLCRLAGLPPVGVLCELVNDDGTVMRGHQLSDFARKHQLHEVTVADLIAYRRQKEQLIIHQGAKKIITAAGEAVAHSYQLPWEKLQHIAVVVGDIGDGTRIPVQFYHENLLSDVLGQDQEVAQHLQHMAQTYQRGVLLYLRNPAVMRRENPAEQDAGAMSAESHEQALAREEAWRQTGVGAQILRHLDIRSIMLLGSQELQAQDIEDFGIDVTHPRVI